ncbi:MAG: phosphatase PAP2 family protein [Gemmatimonadaceae bacterium]
MALRRAITALSAIALCFPVAGATAQQQPPDSAVADSKRPRDARLRAPSRVRGEVQRLDLGEHGTYGFQRPVVLRSLREIPATVAGAMGLAVSPRNLPEWGGVLASSLALYAADEYLLDKTRMLARHVGLPPNHPSINLRFAGMKLPVPSTLGSAIYFLGDGATDLLVAGGFLVHGLRRNDYRALTTASEITTGLVSLGVYTQLLKRSFGRQTPNESTEPRGRWRPFPSLGDYNRNVPGYDALPSGHLAAAMSTVEIIALNYPEKRIVRPLGYTLMTALSFAMVNNGVHWASDYPLALLIGGGVARVTVARGRAVLRERERGDGRGFSWSPILSPSAVGVSIQLPH